jgi:hypothetical protein
MWLRVYCHTAWERTDRLSPSHGRVSYQYALICVVFVDWPNSGTSSHTNSASRWWPANDVPQYSVRVVSAHRTTFVATRRCSIAYPQQHQSPSTRSMSSSVTTHPSLTKTSTERQQRFSTGTEPCNRFDDCICRRALSAWAVQPGHRVPSFRLRFGLPRPRSKLYEICRRWRPGAGAPGTAKLEKDR